MNHDLAILKEKTSTEILFILMSFILPVSGCLLWLLQTNQFPTSDATDYIATAHRIYQHYAQEGFLAGLMQTFLERGWRPIFFPVLSIPFMLLSQGNIIFAYKATIISCLLASSVYLYFYLRFFLDRFTAMVSANLICMLPFVLNYAFIYMAEIALFPLAIGSLYHLVKSNWLTNQKHNIGFVSCITLAILIRPIESITDLILVFTAYFAVGIYHKAFTWKEISLVFVIVLGSTLAFMYFVVSYFMHTHWFIFLSTHLEKSDMEHFAYSLFKILSVMFILSIAFFVYLQSLAKKPPFNIQTKPLYKRPIVLIFSSLCCITLFWFAPFSFKTYGWIYFTSMGDIAATYNQLHPKIPLLTIIHNYIVEESIVVVAGIIFLFLMGLISVPVKKLASIVQSQQFILPLLMLPFPIWEVFNTCQTESRKLSLVISVAFAMMLCIGLQNGKWWRFRVGILLTILTVQFMSLFSVLYPRFSVLLPQNIAGMYYKPITINPNPHNVVLNFLDITSETYHLKRIFIGETYKYFMPVYPYLLMMMAPMFNHHYELFWTGYGIYPDDILTKLGQENDGIFLINLDNDMMINKENADKYLNFFNKETIPDIKIYYGFLYYYAANKLNEIGLEPGPCINFNAIDNQNYKGCILVATRNVQ